MDPIMKLDDLMKIEFPEQMWLVDKLIPAGAVTIMSAPPASYKTWVLLQIAISVSKGESLFSEFSTSQGGVLIIDEESGPRLLQQRLNLLRADSELPIYISPCRNYKVTTENIDNTILNCRAYNIKLVIFDSLVRIHSSDENSSKDMSILFDQLKRLSFAGITVLVTHHNRKPGTNRGSSGNEMRGSSDIFAAIDSHIGMVRKDKIMTFKQTKQRFEQEIEPFQVEFVKKEDSVIFDYLGEDTVKHNDHELLKATITNLIRDKGKLYQKELQTFLTESGVKVNEHKLREVLKVMLAEEKLTESSGGGNTKFYNLVAENHDE